MADYALFIWIIFTCTFTVAASRNDWFGERRGVSLQLSRVQWPTHLEDFQFRFHFEGENIEIPQLWRYGSKKFLDYCRTAGEGNNDRLAVMRNHSC